MKILLMCANGLSTGVLMQKMQSWAASKGQPLTIKAIPISDYQDYYKDYDVMLIGPQMRYKLKEVSENAPETPALVINPMDYGMGNVENIMRDVNKAVKGAA